MFKRLYLLLVLGASTAALVGCGGGNGIDAPDFTPPDCENADASSDACRPPPVPPEPDRCDATPQPADCVADKISITSPDANSMWTKPEMNLVVTFSNGAPEGLALLLNGKDVLSFAAINDEEAAIAGADIEALLVNGNNTFEAKVGTEAEKVTFIYDVQAPRIIVTTAVVDPSGSVKQTAGDKLKVSGLVRDVASIASVTINGAAATIKDHEFEVVVDYSDIYRVSATDSNHQSSEMSFAAPQHRLDPMLAMQINDSIFGAIQPIIGGIFANLDSSSIGGVSGRIPLNERVEVGISRFDLNKGGAPSLDLHFLPSETDSLVIEVSMNMPLVGMGLQTFSTGAATPSADVDLDVSNIGLTLQMTVSSDELNQIRLGLGSVEPFDLSMSGMKINRFDCAFDALCDGLQNAVNTAFSDPVRVGKLMDFLGTLVEPMLADMLADIKISSQPIHIPMDTNGDGKNDTQLSMELLPSLLTTGSQGNAYVELAGSMYVANDKLPAGYEGALGSVYVDAGPVPAFAEATESGKEYDLGIALPSNFLNQAFLSLYQTGAMSNIAMEILPSDLGSMGALLGTVGVGPNDKMRMRMKMGSVPYMVLSHENLGANRTAGIVMHLDNTTIYMDVKKADGTEYSVLMGMVADISANLELGIDENNYIDLGVDNFVNMDVVSVLPVGVATGPLAAAITPEIIEGQIGPAVKGMLKTDTLPGMLKKTMKIAISMADESTVPLQLPMDMGMIMRELGVDASDAYMMIKIDLLNGEDVANSTENVPFKINISKRPPVDTEAP